MGNPFWDVLHLRLKEIGLTCLCLCLCVCLCVCLCLCVCECVCARMCVHMHACLDDGKFHKTNLAIYKIYFKYFLEIVNNTILFICNIY